MKKVANALTAHKFGGSSLKDVADFLSLKETLEKYSQKPTAVIISATQDTTSKLQQTLDLAKTKKNYQKILAELKTKHQQLIDQLIKKADVKKTLQKILEEDIDSIQQVLQGVTLVHDYSKSMQDLILGYGELWSSQILAAFLAEHSKTIFLDASKILFTYIKHQNQQVDWEKTKHALKEFLANKTFDYLIITGFIAANEEGQRTTLGRNGSDFSAAIFAKLLKASCLTIWKDVDGIYSADPKRVTTAFVLEHLSYEEASELAYFGAKVMHPNAIAPAISEHIPIFIKNSFNPDKTGTCISNEKIKNKFLIKALSSIDDIALINIEGNGMIGVSGVAARVFQTTNQIGVSVILISQASSEHSICFAVKECDATKTEKALRDVFQFELQEKQISKIYSVPHCAILAVIGDGMVGTPGIAGKVCYTLAKANINIRAMAQGSSERNISLVINADDINRALNLVHASFYLSNKVLSIALIGPGVIGKTLLKQIEENQKRLKQELNLELRIKSIMDSKKMLFDNNQIKLSNWQTQLQNAKQKSNIDELLKKLAQDENGHSVIIDCTASQYITDQYETFIQKGFHIITPNKKANSGDYSLFQQLRKNCQKYQKYFLYETTVCAGLPVIYLMQELLKTGDDIVEIEGIVSGTLSYVFNELNKNKKFSDIILDAKKQGFTEPDPRDDLSGLDVARKMICLAREMGLKIELKQLQIESLVSQELKHISLDDFLKKLPSMDENLQQKVQHALAKKQHLAYVGCIQKNGTVKIGIRAFPLSHPFSRLQGSDNMLIFKTRRYSAQPLVIQGPGAGAEVTAAGIFADLLRLASYLAE